MNADYNYFHWKLHGISFKIKSAVRKFAIKMTAYNLNFWTVSAMFGQSICKNESNACPPKERKKLLKNNRRSLKPI
jgi:hypothetical protein